jgi:anti-anti-sigma regulatory factor
VAERKIGMPSYQHHIDKHQLFPIDRRGDTLIVTPKGDPCSFANLNFNVEHAALLGLLKNGPYRNLLVDLSSSNYFGAKVLGAIAEWAKRVAEREGQVAVCGASSDMRELLQIYGIKDQWPLFPTREAGIKAIVKESSLQSIKRQWRLGVFLVLILAGAATGYFLEPYFSDQYKNERDYRIIVAIWDEMQILREKNASAVEWRKLRGRAEREIEPLLKDLNSRAGSHSTQARAAQCLLHAGQNCILKRLLADVDRFDLDTPADPKYEFFWALSESYLTAARKILDGKSASSVSFPQQEYDSTGTQTEEGAPPGPDQHSEPTEPMLPNEPPQDATDPEPAVAEPSNRSRPPVPEGQ